MLKSSWVQSSDLFSSHLLPLWFIYLMAINTMYMPKTPKFYLQLKPFPQIPDCKSTCLFEISTWMSKKTLRLIISSNEHLLFSFQRENLPPTPTTPPSSLHSILVVAQVKSLRVILDCALSLSFNLSGKPAGWALEISDSHCFSPPTLLLSGLTGPPFGLFWNFWSSAVFSQQISWF